MRSVSKDKKRNKNFRVGKSKSPPKKKTDLELTSENINNIAIVSHNNIMQVKKFMENVTSKSNSLKNKKISAIKNANSLQILKDSGFFSKHFLKFLGQIMGLFALETSSGCFSYEILSLIDGLKKCKILNF